jgi:hypothetical protein
LIRGHYTFIAVDGGRQVTLSGTFYWEMLDVEKGGKNCTHCYCYSKAEVERRAQAAGAAIFL